MKRPVYTNSRILCKANQIGFRKCSFFHKMLIKEFVWHSTPVTSGTMENLGILTCASGLFISELEESLAYKPTFCQMKKAKRCMSEEQRIVSLADADGWRTGGVGGNSRRCTGPKIERKRVRMRDVIGISGSHQKLHCGEKKGKKANWQQRQGSKRVLTDILHLMKSYLATLARHTHTHEHTPRPDKHFAAELFMSENAIIRHTNVASGGVRALKQHNTHTSNSIV